TTIGGSRRGSRPSSARTRRRRTTTTWHPADTSARAWRLRCCRWTRRACGCRGRGRGGRRRVGGRAEGWRSWGSRGGAMSNDSLDLMQETPFGPAPAHWQIMALSDCAQVQTGVAKGRKLNPDESVRVPYLRVANVQDGFLDLSEIKYIDLRR